MQLIRAEILEYNDRYQKAIEELVLPIQQVEFGVQITREEQPDLVDIKGVFQNGAGNFWVAVLDGNVIGTIGVVDIGDQMVALKKMFVHRDCRGKDYGVAASLMNHARDWCRARGIKTILLGTTAPMTAAHRFYEKSGFVEVNASELPDNFPIVHVDSKFYRHDLG